ncbi:MAG: hypothetical protein ACE14W_13215, partial [Candidatus Velamenicoccus archaeovorus]
MARDPEPVDEEVDRLFTVEPGGFVSARDELVERLRSAGRAEEAAEVRALRRPTVAAWAVDQVVRTRPDELEELLAAGAELRSIQRRALSGVRADGFREAMDRRRRAVAALVQAAERLLRDHGHGSAAAVEAVASTFEAASLDERSAEQVRSGRLSKELPPPSGFGGVTGFEVVAAPPVEAAPEETERAEDREARREAEREARDLANEAARARRRAIKARADADRARERADRLRAQAQDAAGQAKAAAEAARTAERDAERAERAAERAGERAARSGPPATGGASRARTARARRPAPGTS